MKSFTYFTILLVLMMGHEVRSDDKCSCSSKDQCNLINNWASQEKQVVVTTDLTSPYTDWLWDTLTTVLVMNKSIDNQTELMCYAHSKGKQYGFFLDVPSEFNKTELNSFVSQSAQDVNNMHADVIALDFIQLVGNCGYSGQHVAMISQSVTQIIQGIKTAVSGLTVLCVLPWKPPCYDSDCEIAPKMATSCDGLVLNLDSFDTYCQESCTAKAIVPYTKLMLGIEEYISMGFNVSQMLISVPWHGYRYTCDRSDILDNLEKNHICHLKSTTNGTQTVCQYKMSRSKVNLGDLIEEHPELSHQDKTYSTVDEAAWYTVKNTDNSTSLIWFEDILSLEKKYEIVDTFALKGVVIYTADDLSNTHVHTGGQHDFREFMWSWLVHQVFSSNTKSGQTADKNMTNYSGTTVGVSFGMFVLGALMGGIIASVIFKQRAKRYKPFETDMQADEYRDDL